MIKRSTMPLVRTGLIAGIAVGAADMTTALARPDDDAPPETIHVTGTVRDFRAKNSPGGHPDFESRPEHGWARYAGNVAPTIGADGKPLFTGTGGKVASQWRDAEHRPICFWLYDSSLGDTEGSWAEPGAAGIHTADTFNQWFRDDLSVNVSMPLTLTLHRQIDGSYLFDDKLDPVYEERGGFFPIDGMLFNDTVAGHNFYFTFELHVDFEYHADEGQFFKFEGDDDVWVFIDGRLVVDLEGTHAAHDQWVDANRLELVDGETYRMDFFFAERHKTKSSFRVWTNMLLRNADPPMVSGSFD